jgi:penicillin-binding protein-related factor A (putative recombinase)
MTESSYYADITHYYKKHATCSIAWEAKFSRTHRIPFSDLPPHQEKFLLQAEETYGFKIPDNGIGQKPFDGFVLHHAKAVFIAIYFIPRQTEVYEIPIRVFLNEKYTSKEKSLTKEKARLIGTRIFI